MEEEKDEQINSYESDQNKWEENTEEETNEKKKVKSMWWASAQPTHFLQGKRR